MIADFFRSQMDYIFFFYGLAFILLAPICQILKRRPQPQSAWVWLGAFGAAHGVNALLGLLTLSLGSDTAFDLARLVLAAGSFVFLVEFGRAGTFTLRGRGPGRWILAALLGVSLGGFFAGLSGFAAVSRYVLGFGGGLWAAGTLYLASKVTGAGRRAFQGAALGMLGYALTNLVVAPAPFFPAAQLNSESFLALTGLPIQLVTGLLALWLSACLVLLAQASLPHETERRIRVWGKILMFGGVVTVTTLLVAGWFTTQYFGDAAFKEIRTTQESHTKILYRFMSDKMEEAEHLAYTMAGSPWLLPALEHRDTQTIEQANSILDRFSLTLPGSVCYLMDLHALTIASSNRQRADSFVGKAFNFRPYFQDAVNGGVGRYWALGTTSKELGFYASYPVRDRAGQIVGVAVFKRPIGEMEGFFPANTRGFVIDSHGVVIMANRPEMVLQSLWPLSRETKEKLQASRQFGPGPFTPILAREPADRAELLFQGTRQLAMRQPFPWEDWSIVILSSFRPIVLGRLMGIAVTLLSCFVVIGLITIIGLTIDTTARIQNSESRYRLVFENTPVGILQFDKTGTITDCNEKFAEIIGAPKEKVIRFNMPRQLKNEKLREAVLASMKGQVGFYEGDYWSVVGGKTTSVRAIFQGILSPDDEFLGGVGIFEDITERKRAEEALQKSNAQLQTMVAEANRRNQEISLINQLSELMQACLSINETYSIITRFAPELFPALSGGFFMLNQDNNLLEAISMWGGPLGSASVFAPDDCLGIQRGRAYLVEGVGQGMQCRHLHEAASPNYLCLPLIAQGETLGMLHFQGLRELIPGEIDWLQSRAKTVADHVALALTNIKLRETLQHQAIHDPLTGLFNRRYLDETMVREIHRVQRKGAPLGVIMLDLDYFKPFNDTFGHEAGDTLLRALGEFLLTQVRQEDVACRYGGEEFVLIMPEASLDVVKARAEEIREKVPQLQVLHRGQLLESITVSLGVAMFPDHGATGEDVLRAADDAMYQAKREGRNRGVVAESGV